MGDLRSELLVFDRDTIRIRTERCWIDTLAFRRRAASVPDVDAANLQPERLLEGLEGLAPLSINGS